MGRNECEKEGEKCAVQIKASSRGVIFYGYEKVLLDIISGKRSLKNNNNNNSLLGLELSNVSYSYLATTYVNVKMNLLWFVRMLWLFILAQVKGVYVTLV